MYYTLIQDLPEPFGGRGKNASGPGCENSDGTAKGCAAPIDNGIGIMLAVATLTILLYTKFKRVKHA